MQYLKIIYFTSLVAVAWVPWGCQTGAREVKEADPEEVRQELAPTAVAVAVADKKPFAYQIYANGVVAARARAEVIATTGGRLESLKVKPGQIVTQGQVLAIIADQEQALALEKARISLKERQLEYQSQLLAMGSRGDSARQEGLRDNLAYVSGLRAAELAYRQARAQYEATRLKAPIDGRVTDIAFNPGATLKSGDKLCAVYSRDGMVVKTEVLESVIGKVKVGQQAKIAPLALARDYRAVVQAINPQVDENGVVKLTLRLIDPAGLLPGMHVSVAISAPYNKNIIIPETALVIRSGKEVVFVAEDGLAKWHYVTTGLKSNNQVEVLTGLAAGDTVITTNNIYLAHDSPVKIINQNEPNKPTTVNQ